MVLLYPFPTFLFKAQEAHIESASYGDRRLAVDRIIAFCRRLEFPKGF